jgi:CRP-like cAMP-binding protein
MKTFFLNLSDPNVLQMFGGNDYWEKVEFPAGQNILSEGETSQDFYYIVSGTVKVTKALTEDATEKKHLATLGAGDFFGEGSLLSDKGRGANVTPMTVVSLLKLPASKFEALVVADAQAATGILLGIVKVLNARLYAMNQRLVALYDIARITRQYCGNIEMMIPAIFAEVSKAIGHFTIVIFGMDGLPKYKTQELDTETLEKLQAHVPDYANRFLEKGAPESFLDSDGSSFCSVRNKDGILTAILAAELCEEFKDEETRLLNTIAEQIGNVI